MPDTSFPIEPRIQQAPVTRRRSRIWLWWLLVVMALGGGAVWWFWPQIQARVSGTPAATAAPGGRGARFGGPVPVTVAAAGRRDIPLFLDGLGTVQAFNAITIRSQVDGILVEVAFTEGQEVRAGDVLARIDPRSYNAALAQSVAKRQQSEAILANARLDLQRFTELARSNGASRQQLDTQRALVAQNEAQVALDEAAITAARTQVDFTTIRAPVNGRVGIRLVDQGNLVRGGDTAGIVLLNQVTPISVNFTLPQQELPRVLVAMRAGTLPVRVMAPDGTVRATGVMLTPDNQVDQTTGTIRLKATFANEDRMLWPGSFVNVRMQTGTENNALTVPVVAIQRGPDGPFAFVLKDDGTVEQRPLVLGLLTATDAVVMRGLRDGETVVTSGGLRLNNGSAVVVSDPVRGSAEPPRARGARGGRRPEDAGAAAPAGAGGPGAAAPAGALPGGPAAEPAAPGSPPRSGNGGPARSGTGDQPRSGTGDPPRSGAGDQPRSGTGEVPRAGPGLDRPPAGPAPATVRPG